jgi:putative DNA primase/helicase
VQPETVENVVRLPVPKPRQTDVGNAEQFVAKYGDALRYCALWEKWLVWDGRRFALDETLEPTERMKDMLRELRIDAAERGDNDLLAHILRSEREQRIRGALNLARSDRQIAVTPAQLDDDPYLLNCLNGILDLRSRKLIAHDPAALLTKLTATDFDPDATSPKWFAFLDRIIGDDPAVIAYVQRLLGASLVGVSPQVLPILHGGGRNGKSTFLTLLLRLLGDYAWPASSDLLLMDRNRRAGQPRPELADLHGRRFVTTIETAKGSALDESLVKHLTGNDRINTRRLYGHPFTFDPSHTIWLATNAKPEIEGTDEAIWRRVKLIAFNAKIEPAEARAQTELVDDLLTEAAGILRWAVDGYAELENRPLDVDVPESVVAATNEYRDEMDVLGNFLAEQCAIAENDQVPKTALYAAYKSWCESSNVRPLSGPKFTAALVDRGLQKPERIGHGGKWHFLGIGLRGEAGDHE